MTYMTETHVPQSPATAVLAIDDIGLRFHLARGLLDRDVFTMLVAGGDCAADLLGRTGGPTDVPAAVVATCRTAWGVRQLIRRVEELGWDDTRLFFVAPPEEVRGEARRRGASVVEMDVEPEDLAEEILEQAAAA